MEDSGGGGNNSSDNEMRSPSSCSRGHWRPAEDEKLRKLVEEFGPQNWNSIADKLQGRSGKSCRLRWFNQLDPRINRKPFTEEEEEKLLTAHRIHGNKWALISRLFPGRTDNAVKNHWHVVMARIQRERCKQSSGKRALVPCHNIKSSSTSTQHDFLLGNPKSHPNFTSGKSDNGLFKFNTSGCGSTQSWSFSSPTNETFRASSSSSHSSLLRNIVGSSCTNLAFDQQHSSRASSSGLSNMFLDGISTKYSGFGSSTVNYYTDHYTKVAHSSSADTPSYSHTQLISTMEMGRSSRQLERNEEQEDDDDDGGDIVMNGSRKIPYIDFLGVGISSS